MYNLITLPYHAKKVQCVLLLVTLVNASLFRSLVRFVVLSEADLVLRLRMHVRVLVNCFEVPVARLAGEALLVPGELYPR